MRAKPVTIAATTDAAGATASLTLGAGNAAVTYAAVAPGSAGNSLTVTVIQGAGAAAATISGNDVTIDIGSGGQTATQVAALVAGAPLVAAKITATAGGTGASAVATHAKANLAGGTARSATTITVPPCVVHGVLITGAAGGNTPLLAASCRGKTLLTGYAFANSMHQVGTAPVKADGTATGTKETSVPIAGGDLDLVLTDAVAAGAAGTVTLLYTLNGDLA